MKVLQVLLQLLLLLLSDSVVHYVTAQQQQQQLQHQQLQQLPHTEVNLNATLKPKFGTKIANATNTPESLTQRATPLISTRRPADVQQTTVAASSTTPATAVAATRIARRYEAPNAQLVAQIDVPLVQKQQQQQRQQNAAVLHSSASTRRSQRERLPTATANEPQQQQRSNSHNANKTTQLEAARRKASSTTTAKPLDRARHLNTSNVASAAATTATTTTTTTSKSTSDRKVKSRKNAITTANRSSGDRIATKPTTTTTSTSNTNTPPRPAASLSEYPPLSTPFNFLSPSFWSFSNPANTPKPVSTKKPPKKYTPPSSAPVTNTSAKQKKLTYQKTKTTTPTATPIAFHEIPVSTPKKTATTTTDGPFRIALPTFTLFNAPAQEARPEDVAREKEKRNTLRTLRERFVCPRESEVRFQLFPKICKIDEDCSVWNREEICCEIFGAKSCVTGIAKPLEETSHTPILGLIPRKCPARPLAELWWQVQECETDMDCWPRVCCPDGRKRYCRTSQPELETVPVPVKRSFNYLSEYLECTPPPPPIFDLHPKTCGSTFDCFPNVCCQEAGQRHCRPPKKSVLTLMANFLNVDFVKRLTQNIVIK